MNELRKTPKLYLVVPCYNEEEVISKTAQVMKDKLERLVKQSKIQSNSKVLFINDGSKDNTLKILHDLTLHNEVFGVVSFAGNYGHQSAILAGMLIAREYADVVVTIDADLQQDIEAIDEFLEAYMSGSEVVYGVRNNRVSDSFAKKVTALSYYKLLHVLGSNVITNHADYRLMSKKALDALAEYDESNLFLRGLIPTMGFPSDVVYFDVKERAAGESKYTLKKMLTLALDGITSMSVRPLRLISGLGCITILAALVLIVYTLIDWINGNAVQGYTTTIMIILIIGGIIILSLGVIGEYIGKIFMETKKRPRFIIDNIILKDKM